MWLIRLIKCDWLDWISCWLESDGFDDFWFKSLSPWMAIIPNILDSMTPHQQRFWTVLKRIWNGQVMNKHWRKKGIHGYPWVPNKRGLPINPIVYHLCIILHYLVDFMGFKQSKMEGICTAVLCVPDDTEQSIFHIPPTHQILIPLNTPTYINLEHSYLCTIKLWFCMALSKNEPPQNSNKFVVNKSKFPRKMTYVGDKCAHLLVI